MPLMIRNEKLKRIQKTKDITQLSESEILALVQEVLNSRKYISKLWLIATDSMAVQGSIDNN